MTLLFDLMDEYKDALHTDNHTRIKRLGELIRKRMKELEE